MSEVIVPFNLPHKAARQNEFLLDASNSMRTSGNGDFGKLAREKVEQVFHGGKAFLTPSCTAALEMSALILGISADDEVIVPSFTFSSTASAFAIFGAKIIFCDIRPDTFNIDIEQAKILVTRKTKALVVVHYGGVPSLSAEEAQYFANLGVAVIEDNAHGVSDNNNETSQSPLGRLGVMSTSSFHETKNVSCGEGGALLVNDVKLIDHAEIVQEKGTNRRNFFRGQVDKYTWVDKGSSYLMSEFCAAVLYAQLLDLTSIQRSRSNIVGRYLDAFAESHGQSLYLRDSVLPNNCYHLFPVLFPSVAARDRALAYFASRGIGATFHYLPLHDSRAGKKFGRAPLGCPVSRSVSERLLRLPIWADMTAGQIDYVCGAVNGLGDTQ